MDGRASTYKKVLPDIISRLHGAKFVALCTTSTGVPTHGLLDACQDSRPAARLEALCETAERCALVQIGVTIVSEGGLGQLICASYNLFAFPRVCSDAAGNEPGFFCRASALKVGSRQGLNFNTWITEGISYMSRQEEKIYLRTQRSREESQLDEKVGLLHLWKAICDAQLPLVVHGPLDLLLVLAAFEQRPLPRSDPQALVALVRRCTPVLYDTARLQGAMGRWEPATCGLTKLFEDAEDWYEELIARGGNHLATRVDFELQGETAGAYMAPCDEFVHEAGFDSLVVAQLFAYLHAIGPEAVEASGDQLFLTPDSWLCLRSAAFAGSRSPQEETKGNDPLMPIVSATQALSGSAVVSTDPADIFSDTGSRLLLGHFASTASWLLAASSFRDQSGGKGDRSLGGAGTVCGAAAALLLVTLALSRLSALRSLCLA